MFEEIKPHIQELRKRLIISLLAVIISFVACFGFHEIIYEVVVLPIQDAFDGGLKGKLIQLAPLEFFFVAVLISLFTAFIIAIPIIFWQAWLFVAPGLYKHEKKLVLPFVLFGSIMFAAGLLFCYFIVFPFIIKYIIGFGNEMVEANISISEYLSFFMRIMLAFGFVFEMPVVAYFFGKIGLITDETLKKYFKYAVVGIFVIAAIVTPPDVVSQLLLAIPMVLLYGLAYLILKFVNPESRVNNQEDESKEELSRLEEIEREIKQELENK